MSRLVIMRVLQRPLQATCTLSKLRPRKLVNIGTCIPLQFNALMQCGACPTTSFVGLLASAIQLWLHATIIRPQQPCFVSVLHNGPMKSIPLVYFTQCALASDTDIHSMPLQMLAKCHLLRSVSFFHDSSQQRQERNAKGKGDRMLRRREGGSTCNVRARASNARNQKWTKRGGRGVCCKRERDVT
jgi:hypothetical protein